MLSRASIVLHGLVWLMLNTLTSAELPYLRTKYKNGMPIMAGASELAAGNMMMGHVHGPSSMIKPIVEASTSSLEAVAASPGEAPSHELHSHGSSETLDASTSSSGHSHGGMGMSMNMLFDTGKDVSILFPGWSNLSWGEYYVSCIGVIFVGILVEALSHYRDSLKEEKVDSALSTVSLMSRKSSLCRTSINFIRTVLSNLLMLVIMTMNVGLFLCAVLGTTIGYYLFHSK